MTTLAPSPEWILNLPPLSRWQSEALACPARFRVWCCGRQSGKSSLALCELTKVALTKRQSRSWYIAPTYPMADLHWRAYCEMLSALPRGAITINATARRIVFANGSEVEVRSAKEPERLRGPALDLVVVDEAAHLECDGAWLLNAILRPALGVRRGRGLFISTPNGHNWFEVWFNRGLGADEAWRSMRVTTAQSGRMTAEELATARDSMPARVFAQEYEAEFIADGAVIRGIDGCIMAEPAEQREGRRIVFGVDWGKAQDFTVVTALDADTLEVIEIDRMNQVDYRLQRQRLVGMAERLKPQVVLVETNSIGEPMLEELSLTGLPVQGWQMTAQNKPPLIEQLALACEQHRLGLPNDLILLGELRAFTVTRLPSGRWQYGAPTGLHDDHVISLALALQAASAPTIIGGWA